MNNSVKYMLSNMPSFNSNATWVIISAIIEYLFKKYALFMTYLVSYTMASIANHIINIYLASELCSFLIINDYMPKSKRTLKQRNTVFPPERFFFL